MSSVNQLPLASSLALADQFMVWSSGNGDTRRSSLAALLALLQTNITLTLPATLLAQIPVFLPFVGGANDIIASPAASVTFPAYTLGQSLRLFPVAANTGPMTINVSALGVVYLRMNGAALGGGEVQPGVPIEATYDGAGFQIHANGDAVTRLGVGESVMHKAKLTTQAAGYASVYGVGKEGDANTEFVKVNHAGGFTVINSDKLGTGTARPLLLQQAGATVLSVATGLAALTGDMTISGSLKGGVTHPVAVSAGTGSFSTTIGNSLVATVNDLGVAGHYAFRCLNGVAGGTDVFRLDSRGSLEMGLSTSPVLTTALLLNANIAGGVCASFVNQNNATPYGIEMQFSAAAPNDATRQFFRGYDNASDRFVARSNGGLANFSANNVNLSDITVKDVFEDYTPDLLDDLEARFLAIRRGRFKYNDQTHGDWNYGKSAQSVQAALPELAGPWNETRHVLQKDQKEITHMVEAIDTETMRFVQQKVVEIVEVATNVVEDVPKSEQLIAVYDHDIGQIGEALLARLIERVRALEAKAA